MFAVDMDEGVTLHVSHTCTSVDIVQFAGTHGDMRASTRFAGITTAIDVTGNRDARHGGLIRTLGEHIRQWALHDKDCHHKQQPSYRPCHCPISHCSIFNFQS